MLFDSLSDAMRENRPMIGSWILMNDLYSVDMMARAGFDFLCIDMEHFPFSLSDVQKIILAIGDRCPSIVRVPCYNSEYIKPLLDMGVSGIKVPDIRSADQVREAVKMCKYGPLGQRGQCPIRSSDYFENMDVYWEKANRKQVLVVQIEHMDAVNCLDEILAVEGVDAFMGGTFDLSQSMGLVGQWNGPEVVELTMDVARRVIATGRPFGMGCYSEDDLRYMLRHGAHYLLFRADLFMFSSALAESTAIREKMLAESVIPASEREVVWGSKGTL